MKRLKFIDISNIIKTSIVITILLMTMRTVISQETSTVNLQCQLVDESNNPISQAVVQLFEQNIMVLSDENGFFSVSLFKVDDEIIISKEGFKTFTINVGDAIEKKVIVMKKAEGLYDKVVDMPYYKTKRKHNIASTSEITGDELMKHPVTVLENAFLGTVTGMEVYEFNSEPGWSTSEKYIRGLRTMNSSARAPLIIIDNVERDLSFLDAYPIERITIIKDAAASAIYGMRGGNGIIYVTTKRGEPGKTRINLNQEFGYQFLKGMPENQNAYNYVLTINRARYLDGLQPLYSDEDIYYYKLACEGKLEQLYPELKYKYVNTNWRDALLRDFAPQYKTNLNISGGNNITNYFVSFTYLRQEGLYDKKWTEWNKDYSTQHVLERYNLRSNIDINVTRNLFISLDLGGRIDNIRQPRASTWDMFTWSAELHPNVPIFTPKGDFTQIMDNDYQTNPCARVAMSGIDANRRRNLYSNATVTQKLDFITPGLSLKGLIGFDAYNTTQFVQNQNYDAFWYDASKDPDDPTAYIRRRTASPLTNPVVIAREMSYNVNTYVMLNYERIFGSHNIDGKIMMRTYKNVVPGFVSSTRYRTYTGILNYVYNDRIIFQGVLTYMGSDNYQKDRRYGFFPGISAGYVLSEENFIKKLNFIDLLKFRASFGQAGQNQIGVRRYPHQSEYREGGGYNFGTSQAYYEGVYESAAGNPNIKWELSTMANIGLDFDLFKKKLYGSVDVFKEWRSNILVNRSTIPDLYGITIPQDSYGKAETKGIEGSLGILASISKFNFNLEGNITYNTNKIVEMDEIKPLYDYQALTGTKIGQNMVYIFEKWFQSYEEIANSPYQGTGLKPGNAKFVDLNNDGVIDQYDMKPYGYSYIPEIVIGGKAAFEWKGFEARIMLVGQLNRSVYLRENVDHGFFWNGCSTHEVVYTWGYFTDDPYDPRNVNAKYPRLSTKGSPNDRDYPRNQSTIWLKNGNFVSIKNIEIGYSLPKKLISKAYLSKARIYLSGYNLYTFDHIKFLDPESPMNFIWQYPKTRTFSIGLNIGF